MTSEIKLITPDWSAPSHIKAFTTTRFGGVSQPPYEALNLGDHVGDNAEHVQHNRQLIQHYTAMPVQPCWLQQVHGTRVINADDWHHGIAADAIFARRPQQVCPVLTADCLPVLLTDQQGQQVAAIHAGWRGLLNGIIETTLRQFTTPTSTVLAWLGPAIGPQQFEVGSEVYAAFVERHASAAQAFIQTDATHYLADIYQLAKQRLQQQGVKLIFGGEHCTVQAPQFYSYRRDKTTGRMISVIWIDTK